VVRKYLATFVFPKLDDRKELASLASDVKSWMGYVSGEDLKVAIVSESTVAYLFTSSLPAQEIDLRIPSSIKWLMVEVGESFAHHALPNAGNWLWERRKRGH
jgi:hypothetical protein